MTPAWFCQKCHVETGTIIVMAAIDADHCKCPRCKTEVWPDYDAPDLDESDPLPADPPAQCAGPDYVSRSLPEGYRVPPGGSKSGKRAKKKGTKTYDDNGFCG